MAYTDFIAAIDLGTSCIVGMVGTKNAAGVLSIIATDRENSATGIRRGCVFNVEETAHRINRLIQKLENQLNGSHIKKVYVGIGGQSLRSVEHTVTKVLGTGGAVTDEIIHGLYQECISFHPDMLDVLAAVSPVYFLDGKCEPNPVGIPCTRIEARYRLIVGRPSLRNLVVNSIAERAHVEIAGIIISPLALADVVLNEDEKQLGCALIGFGAGVTTLTVYKGGKLVSLSVIPFGGNTITRDITSLHMAESEAERVKLSYGSAIAEKEGDLAVQVSTTDGQGMREIKLAELNNVIEARVKEILENVYARIEATGLMNELGAGIVITGGGAALKNLSEAIQERFKTPVRYSSVRRGVVSGGDMIAGDPQNAVAIGLLMHGKQNCAFVPAPESPKPEPKPEPKYVEPEPEKSPEPELTPPSRPGRKETTSKSSGKEPWWKKLKKNINDLQDDLFKDQM